MSWRALGRSESRTRKPILSRSSRHQAGSSKQKVLEYASIPAPFSRCIAPFLDVTPLLDRFAFRPSPIKVRASAHSSEYHLHFSSSSLPSESTIRKGIGQRARSRASNRAKVQFDVCYPKRRKNRCSRKPAASSRSI